MLKQKIIDDMHAAMIAQDAPKLSTIRMLKSAIQYFEIQKGGAGYEASDEDVIDVIGKEIKKRREAIELYKKGNRQELADKEKAELETLQQYLPEQLSDDEVKRLVEDSITKSGASTMSEMGKVMGILMPQLKGKANSQMVSNLVRKKLNN